MIGSTLSHYKIVSELGRGGMGIVYKAEDSKLDRTVAIKVLPSAALASEDDRERFYREAKAAAQLHHPHIASVFEIDEAVPEGSKDDDLRPFIAMEFIEGRTLDAKIKDGPLKLEDAVRIATEIASALEAAHKKDIVHRDIKSQNVMLTEEGAAKVLDFGLAQTAQSTKLTRMGSTLGTIAYMSPEQARSEEVDLRTDLWSLGVVFYEMIAGKHPFPGDYEQAAVYSILNEDPEPLTAIRTGLSTSIDWIVGKLLAKKQEDRYQNATDLLVDLKTADLTQAGLSRTGTHSRISSLSSTRDADSKRPGSLAFRFAFLAVGLLVGMGLMFLFGPTPTLTPPPIRKLQKVFPYMSESRFPVISNSGRYVAIVGTDSLEVLPFLRVTDLQSGAMFVIGGSFRAIRPSFSPDETQIAFIALDNLKIASVNGGQSTIIAKVSPHYPSWSEEGALYFLAENGQLMVLRADGALDAAPRADSTAPILFPMDVLPGGKYLLVGHSRITGQSQLSALNLETGELKLLIPGIATRAKYVAPDHLIIQSGLIGTVSAYPFSLRDLVTTGLSLPILSQTRWDSWFVSKTGHLVTRFQVREKELEFLDFNFGAPPTHLIWEKLNYEDFQISPSGKSLAVEVNAYQDGNDQILLFDLENETSRQLTYSGFSFEPTWSPDESKIAFGHIVDGEQGISTVRLDGVGGIEHLIQRSDWVTSFADWSPNGEFLLFGVIPDAGDWDIWKYSFTDSSSSVIISDVGQQDSPRISPNNRFVTYKSTQTGTEEVWVFDLLTQASQKVTQSGGVYPIWGHDGRSIFYKSGTQLMSVQVNLTNGFRQLSQPKMVAEMGAVFYFDIGNDGRIIIVRELSNASTILDIHQNWGATLSRN